MIKKNGEEIIVKTDSILNSFKFDRKNKNVLIAKETLEICFNKQYTFNNNIVNIAKSLEAAIDKSVHYLSDLEFEVKASHIFPTIEVVNETTTAAAVRLLSQGKDNLVALNFAAARNPGGGVLTGASAQEEDLCRASGLYTCIKSKPNYYNNNILCENTFYTNDIIYSPKVPFFRDENKLLLENPYEFSIITCPAPNLIGLEVEGLNDILTGIFRERIIRILKVAAYHNHKNIILGAWGCGAFCNDPVMVANAFLFALKEVPRFEYVCFGVYDKREPPHVYQTFKDIIKLGY